MSNRDDFLEPVKRAVAARAGYRCSFAGCSQVTIGPSDEAMYATASIGEAAHISAAAPGGKRYKDTLTPAERSRIDNAIWLCANHARLVDRDEAQYTIGVLQDMKRSHEADCAKALAGRSAKVDALGDLFAVGPEVVCLGDLVLVEQTTWEFHIRHYLIGDLGTLISYIDGFDRRPRLDQYILANSVGDGRLLRGPPSYKKEGSVFVLRCPVSRSFPRIQASEISPDLAMAGGDLTLTSTGDIATVSGVAALPQQIRNCLSVQKGEMRFSPAFGTQIAQYFAVFRESEWLGRLIKLEVVRLASIPYQDRPGIREYTPLLCVDRVCGIQVLKDEPTENKMPILFDLDVMGIGRWRKEIKIFIRFEPA